MPAPTMAIAGVFRATVRSGQPLGSDGCKPTHTRPPAANVSALVQLTYGVGHAGVEADLVFQELVERGRIERQRIDAQSPQPLLHCRIIKNLCSLLPQFANDLGRDLR